jgi:hypothetical protein
MKKSIKYIAILILSSLLFVSCTDLDEDEDLYKNQIELTSETGDEDIPPPLPPPE